MTVLFAIIRFDIFLLTGKHTVFRMFN